MRTCPLLRWSAAVVPLLFGASCLMAVSAQASPSSVPNRAMPQLVSAKDPLFRYAGRVDQTLPDGVGLIWQSTRAEIEFVGTDFELVFAQAEGQNFFDLRVDDTSAIIEVVPGASQALPCPLTVKPGRHRLVLFKRSEAGAGHAVFVGIRLPTTAKVFRASWPEPALHFEFFGDSITVGACDEDGATDQWETRRTHNSARSYAALVSEAFQADHRNISVSGMGVITGYVDVTAGQTWDRLYPSATSPKADLEAWKPQVVFVNYGENDTSFTQSKGQPFPASFSDGYIGVVKAMRAAYPDAEIVLLRGGMSGCAENLDLRAAWNQAVEKLEAGDNKITHFVFKHFSHLHPRVEDHRALADELIGWLKNSPFVPTHPWHISVNLKCT